MSLDTYRTLVNEFGTKLGVPAIEADEEGYVALTFDDLTVHLQYDAEEDGLIVFTRLGEIEEDRAEQIYRLLLGANLFWQGAKGATFSIEPATGMVFLADRQAMGSVRLEGFVPWLERFLDVAGYWSRRLESVNAGGPLDEESTDEEPGRSNGGSRPASDFFIRG